MAVSLVVSQILAAAFLFITTIACGVCPAWIGYYVKRRRNSRTAACGDSHSCLQCPEGSNELQTDNQLGQKTLSFLMNFGGGVLFATSILHMLPEVRESFEEANNNATSGEQQHGPGSILPLTELLVCAGFFLIYLAEEIAHLLLSHKHGSHEASGTDLNPSHLIYNQTGRKQEQDCLKEEVVSQSYGSICEKGPECSSSLCDNAAVTANPSLSKSESSSDRTTDSLPVFRCIMIIFALSFHSIFDGLAIGLQQTTAHMIQLLFAISMHKLLIAFVVGLEVFSETQSIRKVILYMLPFSLMSPVGVVAAAFAKVNMPASAVGILSALSAGSLLYIAFFEILFREKKNSKLLGIIQFFAVALGFVVMAVLQAVTEH